MKEIFINIRKEEDFYEKYNNQEISKELLKYIINSALESNTIYFKLKIESSLNIDFEEYIKNG